MTRAEIAPSILSADFARLSDQIALVEPYSGRIHVDVMDGHFVPNITVGPVVVESIREEVGVPIEVHLMINDPAAFVGPFARAGANRLVFHVEVVEDGLDLARRIKGAGMAAGIAINPQTSLEDAVKYMDEVDLIIVMTVNPGFGGQQFMTEMLPKVAEARRVLTERGLGVDIEVDGGVDLQTARLARAAGANIFVAGHAIFRAVDPAVAARQLQEAVTSMEG